MVKVVEGSRFTLTLQKAGGFVLAVFDTDIWCAAV